MQQIEFSWKTNDGLNLFAKEWKPEGNVKAVVALVHGIGEHIGRYDHVAEAFGKAGYAMVGFDQRGHGKSDGVRGYESYKDLMVDITRNIQNAKDRYPGLPVFLYGHSLGGNLVLYYTLTQKPELKGVIATSPGLATAEPYPPAFIALMKLMYKVVPSLKVKNGLDLAGLSRDPQVAEKYTSDPLVHPFVTPRLGLDMLNAGNYCVEHAAEFPLPLLLMQGTADRLVSPKRTKDFAQAAPLSKITYKEWDGFYHEMHNEPQKEEVINTMIKWMDQELM